MQKRTIDSVKRSVKALRELQERIRKRRRERSALTSAGLGGMKDGRSLSTISKPLGDTGLFEDRVGGVSGLDLLIDDEVVIRDRTEPDLVITFSLSVETTGVVAQRSFELPSKRLRHSGCQRHELLPVAGQLKREMVARNVRGKQTIRFDQLRNHV